MLTVGEYGKYFSSKGPIRFAVIRASEKVKPAPPRPRSPVIIIADFTVPRSVEGQVHYRQCSKYSYPGSELYIAVAFTINTSHWDSILDRNTSRPSQFDQLCIDVRCMLGQVGQLHRSHVDEN